MEYIDCFYKFNSLEEFLEYANNENMITEDGDIKLSSKTYESLVIVGKIIETYPVFDSDMNLISDATFKAGFHVNLRCYTKPQSWSSFEIDRPQNPVSVWA